MSSLSHNITWVRDIAQDRRSSAIVRTNVQECSRTVIFANIYFREFEKFTKFNARKIFQDRQFAKINLKSQLLFKRTIYAIKLWKAKKTLKVTPYPPSRGIRFYMLSGYLRILQPNVARLGAGLQNHQRKKSSWLKLMTATLINFSYFWVIIVVRPIIRYSNTTNTFRDHFE